MCYAEYNLPHGIFKPLLATSCKPRVPIRSIVLAPRIQLPEAGNQDRLAGTITYAIYVGWNLPQGYWAVFAALVVTQANVGASWKAALYHSIAPSAPPAARWGRR
jgi:hypothetical protein